ncbi:glycerophosphodiester phosphodiesterase GDPD6-like [Leguminivora glycinivorella]|uniref:glycerophosphodiester phosphodiesterase GDPD6-like n=1 Tax=Leguminivora glycinivorella TaxID=1035111 RepID=UPI00200FDADD|nr:glycerophosphodiester phosphodiesterase GDPD6-like [Leguminivora glycinivorella]
MKANGGRILVVITILLIATLCVTAAGLMKSVTNTKRSPDLCHPLVIAHRGASGYVPEHTLGAYSLAITMGADYVEPDVVITKDGHLVARHDNELGLTTDVSQRSEFADRRRTQNIDGTEMTGWFTEDFTLDELKTLRAIERIPQNRPGNARMDGAFDIPTIQEIIDLVKSLEISQRRIIGIYPEIKHSTHFQRLGLPIEGPLVTLLHNNGYEGRDAPIYIQSFEVNNLKELKKITDLKLLQLYSSDQSSQPFDQAVQGTNLTYGAMATSEGLQDVASYAYAVGPDKSYVIPRDENNHLGNPTMFVADAHAAGLKVHPYTFRTENTFLPAEFNSSQESEAAIGNLKGEISVFLAAGIDGLFADHPDIPVRMRGPCL